VNIGIVRRVSVFWRQLRQLASMSRPCMAEAYPVARRYAGRPAGVVRPVRGGMVRDAAARLTGAASKYRSPSHLMA
jgi:hypothetical protein